MKADFMDDRDAAVVHLDKRLIGEHDDSRSL